MNLNFWQWLGVALLAIGVLFYLFERTTPTATPPSATTPPSAVAPTTAPTP